MDLELEQLTHENYPQVRRIDRADIPETFVDSAETIMATTDYGYEHHLIGHTYAVKLDGAYIGLIMLGEALHWDTDPPEMALRPFYRLMGFVIDRRCRNRGLGGEVLRLAVEGVYREFGPRPIALGCHQANTAAARFYVRHGFRRTDFREGNDIYYIRYPQED